MRHYASDKGALISAWKCTKSVWRQGSTRSAGEAYNAHPKHSAELRIRKRDKEKGGENTCERGQGEQGHRWGADREELDDEGQQGGEENGRGGEILPHGHF